MPRPRKDSQACEMYAMYREGFTLAQIGASWGVSRQSVYDLLSRRGYALRSSVRKQTVDFAGDLYAPDPDGYWRKTRGDRKWLHHAVWESEHGEIPKGFHIHHIDEDKANNTPANLVCVSPSEHGRIHKPFGEVALKPCLWCGRPLIRKRSPGGQLETPAAVARRTYCNTTCQAAHRRGKPRTWSPLRERAAAEGA